MYLGVLIGNVSSGGFNQMAHCYIKSLISPELVLRHLRASVALDMTLVEV